MAERNDVEVGKRYLPSAARWTLDGIKGHANELEMLQHEVGIGVIRHKDAAPRFRQLIDQNPEWQFLLKRYGDSPKHLVRLLVELYPERFLAYNHLYRLTSSIDVGEASSYRVVSVIGNPLVPLSVNTPDKRSGLADILMDCEVERRFPEFVKDPSLVLEELTKSAQVMSDPLVRESYARALGHFQDILNLSIGAFKPEYQPRLYQAEAILKGLHRGDNSRTSIGIFDEMGTGKTLEGLGRAEYLDIQRSLIVVPAGVKGLWQARINEYYISPPKSRVIESSRDVQNGELKKLMDNRFIIVSYDLLVGRNGDDEVINAELFETLKKFNPDGLIVDESHYANNFRSGTKRAAAVMRLAHSDSVRHRMLLTGTPVDKVKDMDMIAHLLDPESYPDLDSFSEKNQGNPRISHNELLSKVIRRTSKEVLELPPYGEKIIEVDLTPTQRALFDFIYNQEDEHQFTKLSNLRKAVLHPRLVGDLDITFNKEKALIQLGRAYIVWKRKVVNQPSLQFDSDFLVSNGFGDLYISALVNLDGGVSQLVKESGSKLTEGVWKGETLPAKFVEIKKIIEDRLNKGEKVVIFSSFFVKGITQDFPNSEGKYYQSLLKFLQSEFGEKSILKIDGSDKTDSKIPMTNGEKVSERELIRRSWQRDRDKKIIVVSARASSLGIDLSINDPSVTGVSIIVESLPFSCGAFDQSIARVLRFGQVSPVTTFIIEAKDSIDKDTYFLLQEKKKILNILLDAVPLTEQEEHIWEESPDKIGSMLTKMIRSPRQNVALIFGYMLGKSYEQNLSYLSEKFTFGETNDEYLAKWHDEIFKGGYSGYCSQVVKIIIDGLTEKRDLKFGRIADWGSGPLVLSRTLGRPALSLDIGPAMLRVGQQKAEEIGIIVPDEFIRTGSISEMPEDLFEDNSIDLGICSLVLDCTASGDERVKSISKMHKSMSPGGYLLMTFPVNEMGASEFHHFKSGFSKLGFSVDSSLSGYVKGITEGENVFNTWVFVLKKTGQPEEDVDSDLFLFSFEKKQKTKDRKEAKRAQKLANYRIKKVAKVEQFFVYEPKVLKTVDQWGEKGDLESLLGNEIRNHVLDLSEQELLARGYKVDVKARDRIEEIGLTRI